MYLLYVDQVCLFNHTVEKVAGRQDRFSSAFSGGGNRFRLLMNQGYIPGSGGRGGSAMLSWTGRHLCSQQ